MEYNYLNIMEARKKEQSEKMRNFLLFLFVIGYREIEEGIYSDILIDAEPMEGYHDCERCYNEYEMSKEEYICDLWR